MREKLIEFIRKADKEDYLSRTQDEHYAAMAGSLIANGVTLDNQVSSSKWIPVSERLPTREDANETESILAINKDEGYVGRWIWDIVARWPTHFTHWMPLPEPPKEG